MKSTKRIHPTYAEEVEVALNSPIAKEDLPYQYVHYPNHYGTFIGFSEKRHSNIYFCKCIKPVINEHLEKNSFKKEGTWTDNTIMAPLSSHYFPNSISKMSLQTPDINSIIKYERSLCHRCNLATPTLRYCVGMYGSRFKQFYGWYIKQNEFKYQLANKMESDSKVMHNEHRLSSKELENLTREEFGFRKIGEGNVSETLLTRIVAKIYSGYEIFTHYRPDWLEKLELDIYIPKLKIGIEYQGQQHFHPIKAWGGEKALKRLQERDARKRILCIKNMVKLIEVDYTEPLEINYI